MSGTAPDFLFWEEELVETDYLHVCACGSSTNVRRSGTGLAETYVDPRGCPGCRVRPITMRAMTAEEKEAYEADLWPGLPREA